MTRIGPWASIRPSRAAAREQARADRQTSGGNGSDAGVLSAGTLGDWHLTTNEHGDLVAVHSSGIETVLATINDHDEQE